MSKNFKKYFFLLSLAGALFFIKISVAQAADPVLFFSDLNWGPKTGWEGSATKGAAVTVWGKNFGSSRGSNYITVGGVNLTSASDYAEWGTTGTSNNVARGLERITFWLNSSMASGNVNISITINGVTSNTLPFNITTGTIYFISVSDGNNSYNGLYSTRSGHSGSDGPFRDLLKFNPDSNPSGDGQYIVYVKGGTYTALDADGAYVALRGPYGGATKQKALIGYPGETALLNMAGSSRGAIWSAEYSSYGQNSYFTFSKLKMIGGPGDGITSYGNYNRIIGNVFQNIRPGSQFQSGTVFVSSSNKVYIYGNYWDNTGYDSYGHAIYIKTQPGASGVDPVAQYVYVGWNEISNPYAIDTHGGAIFLSKESTVSASLYTHHIYIHDNYFHDGSESDFIYADDGQRIDYVWVWNNILTGGDYGADTESAIFLTFGDLRHFYIYNNTFYNVASTDQYSNGVISIVNDSSKQDIRLANNILVASHTGQGFIYTDGYTNGITTISSAYDLFYSPTGVALPTLGGGRTNSVTGDPRFTNASARDFSLQSTSPAINRGTTSLITDANSDIPIATRDYNGLLRGSAYDIGAIEYASGGSPPDTTPPSAPTNVRIN